MENNPTLLPVLKKFGLSSEMFSELLKVTNGIIAGGIASTAFFGKPLNNNQDLDVWVPIPFLSYTSSSTAIYNAPLNYSPGAYFNLVHFAINSFLINNQKRPTPENLIKMSLDEIIDRYNGVYEKDSVSYTHEYKESDLSTIIRSIDTYINPWTGRRIQIIYTFNTTVDDIMKSFDFDICQFWSDGSNNFQVNSYTTNPATLTRLCHGHAKILLDPDNINSQYQKERLENRVAKYEKRGYKFSWLANGNHWIQPNLPEAPTYSFWQDFVFTTNDMYGLSEDELEYQFRIMFENSGCNFQGSDINGNIDILINYHIHNNSSDSNAGDNWQYTWRFTWDSVQKCDNIYLRSMILLNPF